MPPLRSGAAVLATALLALTTGTLVLGLAAPASAQDGVQPPQFTSPGSGPGVVTTSDTTPTMAGTAEPGVTVKVVVAGKVYCTTVATGAGDWSCTGVALLPGRYGVSATASDSLRGSSGDRGICFDLEISAPPPPPPPPPLVETPVTAPVVVPPPPAPTLRAAPRGVAAPAAAIVWDLHVADLGGTEPRRP